jgi:chromosome segregation ATPase
MDWNAILNGAMGAGAISIILRLIDAYSNRSKISADAAKTLVEGGKEAVQAARELLAEQRAEIKEMQEESKEQAAKIENLEEGKRERLKRIEDLESQVSDLVWQNETLVGKQFDTEKKLKETDAKQVRDLEETQRLRNDYANAQKQIISAQTQITKLEDTLIRAGEFIDKIKIAVQSIPGVDLPLNGELMDSILRLKAERAKRGKQ